jgi:mono/diheme cytochrome c family protein
MKLLSLTIILAAPLLIAAIWMDDQQSYKPYEAPVLSPPASAVPITGRENVERDAVLKNPVAPDAESLSAGRSLFEINCTLCHGTTSAALGLVGKKLNPPPPGLDQAMVKSKSDSEIFKAMTFGFGRMPSFRDKLTPRERWDLTNFLRARK